MKARLQAWVEILGDLGPAVAARIRAGHQVFLDRQMAETVPPLHHLDAAALHQFRRREMLDLLALEADRALGHLAALGAQQVRNRLQRRRLARAVRAQNGDDTPAWHGQRHALQDQDHVIVDHLDIVDRQKRVPVRCGIQHRLFSTCATARRLPAATCAAGGVGFDCLSCSRRSSATARWRRHIPWPFRPQARRSRPFPASADRKP